MFRNIKTFSKVFRNILKSVLEHSKLFRNIFKSVLRNIVTSVSEYCSGTLRRFSKSVPEYFQKCSETIHKVPEHFYSVSEHFQKCSWTFFKSVTVWMVGLACVCLQKMMNGCRISESDPDWRWLELVISSPAISAQPNRLSVFAWKVHNK